MIPVDLTRALHDSLRDDRREPDGLLHCSSDLVGSLRHSMLRAAGAPTIESELVSDVRLMTGTFWHRYFGELLVNLGIPFMQEVKLNPWLPEGWSGTADWLFWDANREGFVLGDLKTTKGEAIKFLKQEGAKKDHIWQTSAYWHACIDMGLPMVDGIAVYYLPMNDTQDKAEYIEPVLIEFTPLKTDILYPAMEGRWEQTKEYFNSLPDSGKFVTAALAPVQERVQKVYWNGKIEAFEVKLVPHWSAAYCPFPNELCDCSEQGTTKIGEYYYPNKEGEVGYKPRAGYEHVEPLEKPSPKNVKQRYNL